MSNATQSLAGTRITSLLDANSFVEIGQGVTARSTDFNMTANKAPSDGVITGYGVIDKQTGLCIQPGCICIKRYCW